MPGDKRHAPTAHLAHDDVVAGRAEGRLNADPLGVLEELIEPRAADDPDLCPCPARHGADLTDGF